MATKGRKTPRKPKPSQKLRYKFLGKHWEYDLKAKSMRIVEEPNEEPKGMGGLKERLTKTGITKTHLALLLIGLVMILALSMVGGPSSEKVQQSSPGKLPDSQAPPAPIAVGGGGGGEPVKTEAITGDVGVGALTAVASTLFPLIIVIAVLITALQSVQRML